MKEEALRYYDGLVGWLVRRFPDVDHDLRLDAAHDAILLVLGIEPPGAHRAGWVWEARTPAFESVGGMRVYLRRAASFRLSHLIRHERDQQDLAARLDERARCVAPDTLRVVLGREALREAFAARVPEVFLRHSTMTERWLVELFILGLKGAEEASHVLGVAHLPWPERRATVRAIKNRVRKKWLYAVAHPAQRAPRAGGPPRKVELPA
jgi:hypothetical protein